MFRKSTIDYVYNKLKTEIIRFLENEIDFNEEVSGEQYRFTEAEQELYDTLCNDMIEAIENSSIDYDALTEHLIATHKGNSNLPF